MKKIILNTFLGLFILLIMLLLVAPATSVLNIVSDKVPGLKIENVTGSIWDNSISRIGYKGYSVSNVKTNSSIWNLLFGRLKSDIEINDPELNLIGQLALSSSSLEVNEITYQISSDWINRIMRNPQLKILGDFSGQILSFAVENNKIKELSGTGDWKKAIIEYPNNQLELGDFNYQLSSPQQDAVVVTIVDNNGILDLKGTITLNLNKTYKLDVSTTNQLPSNLSGWLKAFGKEKNNRVEIVWKGRIP